MPYRMIPKIKMFNDYVDSKGPSTEEQVNKWLAENINDDYPDRRVIDIKYSTLFRNLGSQSRMGPNVVTSSVLILYMTTEE